MAALALCIGASAADTLKVATFRHAGPFRVLKPHLIDSVRIDGKAFDAASVLDEPLREGALGGAVNVQALPVEGTDAVHVAGFSIENGRFAKARLNIEGLDKYSIFVDGHKQGRDLKLEPGTHEFVIRYFVASGKADSTASVSVLPEKDGVLSLRNDGRRIFSLDIDTYGEAVGAATLSPSGRYVAVVHSVKSSDGKSSSYTEILETSGLKLLERVNGRVEWMPSSDRYYERRKAATGTDIICTDPATHQQTIFARDIPEGWFTISPTEDFLIYSMTQKGPKEGDVHQILAPDDRQPGWRDRSYLSRYDLATGMMQQLTFGWHNAWLSDISADGRYLLFGTSRARLTARPTTLTSLYMMDLATLETVCLVEDDGFIGSSSFSPDGRQVLVTGSPEAFGGIGNILPEGKPSSMIQQELFVLDVESRDVRSITRDFYPCVQSAEWSRHDGRVYVLAEDKDCRRLFRIDPRTAQWERIESREDYIYGFSLAESAPLLSYYGQSLCNSYRSYLADTRKGRQSLLADADATRLAGVVMGQGDEYEFTSSRGDVINGFYVLPPDFDPAKKYPLIVHYYGGCSPTTRYAIGSYSPQLYAAQGYVFYVVNPSGATGFGQEFASRHVNTAGDVVADDIIEGVRHFCADHQFVDSTRIGCFSASYGGFMTQLLLSRTDLFATGISHAGISDHTSYWGEGYWGYSYSEVSMADSYPWTRKDLYVDRSPLYFADRIQTPLLFLHGSADTNVPIGESIQMFTALKLLGRDTAFVVVDGENHGISDFKKQRQWLRTISAWFAKYLQDDSTWWDELYPPASL